MFPEFDQNRIRNFIQNAGQPCVAIFEIGTRAVRLLVAPKMVPAKWEEGTFCGDSIMPNLGFDVGFTDKHLSRDADSLRSTIDFLNSRTLLLRQKGVCEFSVIGTAWFRWLINADEIARYIEEVTGHQIELIQQEREAELTIAGLPEVLRRTNSVGDLAVDDLVLFFDQGGGSLEVSWMRWGQSDEARPYIGHRKFDRLGTVALRRNFFYYSADESNPDGGRQLRDPEKNRARVFAQVRRIQNEAKIELLENWMDLGALIRSSPSRRAYAVGSAITNIFPNRRADVIHSRVARMPLIRNSLEEVSAYYDSLQNPVLTIYKKLRGLHGAGVDRIEKTAEELDRDLIKLYGLPIYIELMTALNIDHVFVLGYPLRFGYYIWKYLRHQPISSVRPDASGPYVFISYAKSDKALIYDQLATLDGMGVRVWWDEGLQFGREFERELAERIAASEAVMMFLTPQAVASDWVSREMKLATHYKKLILPVELSRTLMPPEFLFLIGSKQRLQWFELREDRYRESLRAGIPVSCFKTAPDGSVTTEKID